ncbi:MAG: DUF4389 domain-containing protein [Gammaproteobacteria bacterium]
MNELEKTNDESDLMRLLYMFLFAVLFNVSEFVIYAIMVIQFVLRIATGKMNDQLLSLGQNIARYASQLIEYLTFITDEKPYPFSPWPGDKTKNKIL